MMQEGNTEPEGSNLGRILMLVPHEPEADPRIEWVKELCLEVGPTDVIGGLFPGEQIVLRHKPSREFDGGAYVERISVFEYASIGAKWLYLLVSSLHVGGTIRRYIRRENEYRIRPVIAEQSSPALLSKSGLAMKMLRTVDHQIGAVCRFFSNLASYGLMVSALYRRGRASSIRPRLILCHDIFALASAVLLKRVFHCPIVYDSHELWPEADLIAQEWEKQLTAWIEGKLIQHADVVVTVSPPLARHLERLYGLAHVVSAPNAEPIHPAASRLRKPACAQPIKFLLQGRVSPRRGIEELFEAWRRISPADAVLFVRCPQNEYLFELQNKFHRMIETGSLVLLPAVGEEALVEAATFADVGVIPYRNTSLIHEYCCPNKLSQYMQAGLALVSNKLHYVSEVIAKYQCGKLYDAADPQSLCETVSQFVRNRDELARMKENAFRASQDEFHWEAQSIEYRRAVRHLYAASPHCIQLASQHA